MIHGLFSSLPVEPDRSILTDEKSSQLPEYSSFPLGLYPCLFSDPSILFLVAKVILVPISLTAPTLLVIRVPEAHSITRRVAKDSSLVECDTQLILLERFAVQWLV
jgi:hypothetical protein